MTTARKPDLDWLEYMAAGIGPDRIRRVRDSGTVVVFDVEVTKVAEIDPEMVGQGSPLPPPGE